MSKPEFASGPPRALYLKADLLEDKCSSFSVGGLASDLGILGSDHPTVQPAFGRLIEYARRRAGLSVEGLAERAEVDLAALLAIETQNNVSTDVRTIYQIAQVLNLPATNLMQVAGLSAPKPAVSRAAMRFAARSEPSSRLSRDERQALEEFVKALAESTDED